MLNWLSWFPRRMIRTQGEGKKGKLQLGPHILRSELQAGHTGQAKRSPNQPAYHQPSPYKEGLRTGSRVTGLKNTAGILRRILCPNEK